MPGNATNTTNGTAPGGGGAPPAFGDGGGVPGLEIARAKIQGLIDGLSGAAGNALKGLQTALDSIGLWAMDPDVVAAATEVTIKL